LQSENTNPEISFQLSGFFEFWGAGYKRLEYGIAKRIIRPAESGNLTMVARAGFAVISRIVRAAFG
jgi:hypothetical protein